jgi:hypothetical protein
MILEIGQKTPTGLVVGVRNIVSGHRLFAGHLANSGHQINLPEKWRPLYHGSAVTASIKNRSTALPDKRFPCNLWLL